jgi:hypothetical protein
MAENEHNFRKLVAGLKIDAEPDPAHRERLRRQMLQTFEETSRASRAGTPKVIPLRHVPFSRLAIAAAVLVAATIGAWAWLGRGGPMTFDQVRLATERMPWMHAVVKGYQNGDTRTVQHWYNFTAKTTYVVTDDGDVLGWDYGAKREQFVYSPRVKAVMVSELAPAWPFGADSAYNLVDTFAVFAARDDVETTTWTTEHEGKTVRAYGIETASAGLSMGGRAAARLKMAVLADPTTKRLVAANVEYRGQDGSAIGHEEWAIDYPQSGPAGMLDLGVPVDVRVIDRRQQPTGTPGNEPSIISTPAPTSSSQNLVPLEIKLPRPQFVGTPQDARTPNLEQARGRPRPPFLAPPGTTNVALGKPVSASDRELLYGSLDMVTDGDKEADDGSFIELGPKPQYVTIDLRERCEVYAVVVWHYHKLPRVYFDVVAQICDDKNFRTGVTTVFNNDRDNSLGLGTGTDLHYTETNEGKLIDSKGVQGRYVRLYSNGNTSDDLNHYIEVEVYGRPVKAINGN